MKKLLQLFMVLAIALGHSACEGDEGPIGPAGPAGTPGPEGPTGPQGEPGESGRAQVFEIPVDFEAPNYQIGFDIADYNEILETEVVINESDVVLAYRAITTIEDNIAWGALPMTYYTTTEQPYTYSLAHANQILILYINAAEATFAQIPEGRLLEQYFRLVVIPGDHMNGRLAKPTVDLTNYEEVIKYYQIDDSKVQKINLR